MSITSLSFTFASLYAPPAAKPVKAAERPAAAAPVPGCESHPPGARQNRLAQAMMSALRELGLGSAAAPVTSAASTSVATAAAPAIDTAVPAASASVPSATPEAAVYQFAHALFQALRQSEGGRASADDGGAGRVEGRGGPKHHHRHHHHHHDHGERRTGYGDLSQRLEALSQTFGTVVPAATLATPPAPAVSNAKNPLLEAFSKLFNALKPATAASTAGTASPTAAATSAQTELSARLRLFLHTLAQALRPESMGGEHAAPVGGLVNLTA